MAARGESSQFGKATRKLVVGLLVLAAIAWAVTRFTSEAPRIEAYVIEGVKAEAILTPELVEDLNGAVGQDFEVTPSGTVLLAVGSNLVALRRVNRGVSATTLVKVPTLQGFTIDASGALLTITSEGLGQFANGGISAIVGLSDVSGTRLARSPFEDRVYLYGGSSEAKGFAKRIAAIARNGQVDYLVEAPAPVTAVAVAKRGLFFSTSNKIYSAERSVVSLVIRLPDAMRINSLAVSPEADVLYFSTLNRVFVLRGLVAVSIATGVGGTLRVQDGNLYLLDPARRFLLKFSDLSRLR